MADFLLYVFLLALFALAVLAAIWVFRSYVGGQSPMAALFGPKPDKRLEVIEHANVDGRRRLMLIRRDDVEHLIMTGGPVDVVIETGIGESRREPLTSRHDVVRAEAPPAQVSFSRPARSFGRATTQQVAE